MRRVLALEEGRLALGREIGAGRLLPDERLSRDHALIEHGRDGWTVRDRGSRNGTYVDGVQVTGSITVPSLRVVRIGNTLIVPTSDAEASASVPPIVNNPSIGEALHRAFREIALVAKTSSTLLVQGESGTGKELAARIFHAEGPSRS